MAVQPELVLGNVFIRPNTLEKVGEMVSGHKHNFDHVTLVMRGAVHVKAVLPNGTPLEADFEAPSYFLVRAGVNHEITATQDDTLFWCVYAHREPQGRITQQYTGWEKAYC